MIEKVILKNKSTGAISEVPGSVWNKVKNSAQWRGVFAVLNVVIEPPEVAELKARKAAQNQISK
jgi:hypothetical protein